MNIEKEPDKSLLTKISSKYILKLVFANLSKGSLLKLLKYNKYYQQIKGLKLQDYKEYAEIIELEIIPASNSPDFNSLMIFSVFISRIFISIFSF